MCYAIEEGFPSTGDEVIVPHRRNDHVHLGVSALKTLIRADVGY
jgi:hypothetical protein